MIKPINYFNNPNNIQYKTSNQPAFKSSSRSYRTSDGIFMETYTYFFRNDLPWLKLINYINEIFENKNKVNIEIAGCSDGSELYTFLMGLMETNEKKNLKKYLPIKGHDIDPEIITAAKSGRILINQEDVAIIKNYVKDINNYLNLEPNQQLVIPGDHLYANYRDALFTYKKETYKINENLYKNATFQQGDAFQILKNLKDNSNTVFFFRNALGHLHNNKAVEFANLAGEKLKPGSLVVIGDFDTAHTYIKSYLSKNGFSEIMKNVWKKMPKL